MGGQVIRTQSLTKFYGRHRGVVDLDLEIEAGEVFGYLGPNGAGKTTTIRLLLDYVRPTRGSASILGLDAHRHSQAIRRRVGYLPGDLRLYESLSGNELLGYFGRLRGRVPTLRITELADRLGADIRREIRTLSSGNRQKLGIIQALMSDPELLILDEPTNGLDPLVQQTFLALMAEARQAGRTVFVSSHVLPEVERMCDRLAIIRDGHIVAVERIADLRMRAVRTLSIDFVGEVRAEAFDAIPGLRDLSINGTVAKATVVGSMDPLLKAISRFEVLRLTSTEPSLEEVFLAYYGADVADAA